MSVNSLEKGLESWKEKYNELEKELNALSTHCGNLVKDLADLEGWKHECTELQLKVTNIENKAELLCFRAVTRERKQWEACEERLVQQLRQLQQQNASTALPSRIMKTLELDISIHEQLVTSSHHKLAESRIQFVMSLSPLHC